MTEKDYLKQIDYVIELGLIQTVGNLYVNIKHRNGIIMLNLESLFTGEFTVYLHSAMSGIRV